MTVAKRIVDGAELSPFLAILNLDFVRRHAADAIRDFQQASS